MHVSSSTSAPLEMLAPHLGEDFQTRSLKDAQRSIMDFPHLLIRKWHILAASIWQCILLDIGFQSVL
jgi:hypothetical protein